MLRKVLLLLTSVLMLGATAFGAAAWHYSNRIYAEALQVQHRDPEYNLRVVAVTPDSITLTPVGDGAGTGWTRDGVWGVAWPDGFVQTGRITVREGDHVTREIATRWGMPAAGELVRLTSAAYPEDPRLAYGLDFEAVRYPGPDGELTGWYVPGERGTWIIAVHGMASTGGDALRLLGTTAPLGYPMLSITYRNDPGAPPSASGRYEYGVSEWQDVEAAVRFARSRGARDVVLAGYSMGGGIVMSFMARSEEAATVAGLILDGPMLDFGATVDYGGQRIGAPRPLTVAAKSLASRRYGLDWEELRFVETADTLQAPVLLFHGEDDTIVPISTSEALAARRPDLVTFERFDGGAHVRSWNIDPSRYEAAVRRFLQEIE